MKKMSDSNLNEAHVYAVTACYQKESCGENVSIEITNDDSDSASVVTSSSDGECAEEVVESNMRILPFKNGRSAQALSSVEMYNKNQVIGEVIAQNSQIHFGNITYNAPVNTITYNDPTVGDRLNEISKKLSRMRRIVPYAVVAMCSMIILFHLLMKFGSWNWSSGNATTIFVMSTIIVLQITNLLMTKLKTEPVESTVFDSQLTPDEIAKPLRIVSREEWDAKPPKKELVPLELPTIRVIIACTGRQNENVREIQEFHMDERGWDDIAYNFLIGSDGAVYVGRGWDKQGAHSKGYNQKSVCIAFIGTFSEIVPPKAQLVAAQKLIMEGVKLKKLSESYLLYGHRQLRPFDSPGLALYKIIQTWDHWSEVVHPLKI